MSNRTESVISYLEHKRVRDAIDRFVRLPKRLKHPPLLIPSDVNLQELPLWHEAKEFIGLYVGERHELNNKQTMIHMVLESRLDQGIIGTAYDLWLKVLAIKLNRLGKNRFRELTGFKVYVAQDYYRKPDRVREMDLHLETLDRFYENEVTDNNNSCLQACLYLAQYPTAQLMRGIKSRFHSGIVDQLAKLASLPSLAPLVGTQVVLSPYFSLSGERVFLEGAGDIFVDGRLYEIKATTEFRIQAALRQIVCYYIMNRMTREHMGLDEGLDIQELIVVLPRYNFTFSLNPDEMFTEDGHTQLQAFFARELGLFWAFKRKSRQKPRKK